MNTIWCVAPRRGTLWNMVPERTGNMWSASSLVALVALDVAPCRSEETVDLFEIADVCFKR